MLIPFLAFLLGGFTVYLYLKTGKPLSEWFKKEAKKDKKDTA